MSEVHYGYASFHEYFITVGGGDSSKYILVLLRPQIMHHILSVSVETRLRYAGPFLLFLGHREGTRLTRVRR